MEINLLTFSYANSEIYNETLMEEGFNQYAARKNLNITLNVDILIYDKPTDAYKYFISLVESSLKKNSVKYEIYFYDNAYSDMYGPYLLNLNNNLPKEHIEMYDTKILNETCYYKDELVGFVMFINKL